jgi:hypothetical protein
MAGLKIGQTVVKDVLMVDAASTITLLMAIEAMLTPRPGNSAPCRWVCYARARQGTELNTALT